MQKVIPIVLIATLFSNYSCDCSAIGKGIVIDSVTHEPIDSVAIMWLFDDKVDDENGKHYTNKSGEFNEFEIYGCGRNGPEVKLKFEKGGYEHATILLSKSGGGQVDTLLEMTRIAQ